MIKANSLLYSVYVCLIVGIICGALLYYASLYSQLNLFYNTNEQLYIQNQSAVNFALGNGLTDESLIINDTAVIKSEIKTKTFGLLKLLIVNSFNKSDTITSAHFVGTYSNDNSCLFVSSSSRALTYSGLVKLIGNKHLSSPYIREVNINNSINSLITSGNTNSDKIYLPELNKQFKRVYDTPPTNLQSLKNIERATDSVYFNSFQKEVIHVQLTNNVLENIIIKGNFILYAKDSLQIKKSAILEDVVIRSPQITISDDFEGSLQLFSTKKIKIKKNVTLNYPSVLCMYNSTEEPSEMVIEEDCAISGAIVQFGNSIQSIAANSIIMNKNSILYGDIYCSGKLMLESKIYGTVYTNQLFYQTKSSYYENCIMNTEIDVSKRPTYFLSVPLFEETKTNYGVFKKVL